MKNVAGSLFYIHTFEKLTIVYVKAIWKINFQSSIEEFKQISIVHEN